jgi:hypothetical protein
MRKIFFEFLSLVLVFQFAFGENKKDTSITLKVQISDQTDDIRLLAYIPKKPLSLSDFSGTPDRKALADAETLSGIFVKYYFAQEHNRLLITVKVIPFFDKSKSWCRTGSRNARTLSHEQLHFDISAIKACEMVREMDTIPLSPSNYLKKLHAISDGKNQEAQSLQDQYDLETKHGRDAAAQEKWRKIISRSFASQSCYKEK